MRVGWIACADQDSTASLVVPGQSWCCYNFEKGVHKEHPGKWSVQHIAREKLKSHAMIDPKNTHCGKQPVSQVSTIQGTPLVGLTTFHHQIPWNLHTVDIISRCLVSVHHKYTPNWAGTQSSEPQKFPCSSELSFISSRRKKQGVHHMLVQLLAGSVISNAHRTLLQIP